MLAYNVLVFGHPGGGYGATGPRLTVEFASALPGVLFSPGRGLFVYFPAALLLLVLLALEPHLFADGFSLSGFASLALLIALTAAWPNWWGGYSYGPRLLTEAQPLVLLLLGVGIRGIETRVRQHVFLAMLILLLPLQVFVQALGTYSRAGAIPAALEWNANPASIDVHPERNWDVLDNPITRALTSREP